MAQRRRTATNIFPLLLIPALVAVLAGCGGGGGGGGSSPSPTPKVSPSPKASPSPKGGSSDSGETYVDTSSTDDFTGDYTVDTDDSGSDNSDSGNINNAGNSDGGGSDAGGVDSGGSTDGGSTDGGGDDSGGVDDGGDDTTISDGGAISGTAPDPDGGSDDVSGSVDASGDATIDIAGKSRSLHIVGVLRKTTTGQLIGTMSVTITRSKQAPLRRSVVYRFTKRVTAKSIVVSRR